VKEKRHPETIGRTISMLAPPCGPFDAATVPPWRATHCQPVDPWQHGSSHEIERLGAREPDRFFDEALTDLVHAQAPYNSKGRRNTTNSNDGIYQGGGSQVLFPLTTAGSGYEGTFNVGVRL
jgi:hypothetical protein